MSLFHILQFFPKEKSTLGLTNKFCSFFCRGTNNYYICIRFVTGCSAVRLARQLRELEVAGSNPVSPTKIKTFALKGKGFLLWAYDGYSSPKVRVQEKRIPLYQAGSLIFVHPIRDSSGSEAERRNPVFPTERRDTKTFLFSFPDSDMSHGKRTAIKNCLRNSFCLCISHQGAI